MKRIAFFLFLTSFLSCSSSGNNNDCFPFININETVNLDLPEFIDLQVPGGFASTRLGGRNILLIRRNSNFQAFDLQCPEDSCSSPMSFDGLKLICSCNQEEYNSLNGAPLTSGASCFAKEYSVENLNGSILRISNF